MACAIKRLPLPSHARVRCHRKEFTQRHRGTESPVELGQGVRRRNGKVSRRDAEAQRSRAVLYGIVRLPSFESARRSRAKLNSRDVPDRHESFFGEYPTERRSGKTHRLSASLCDSFWISHGAVFKKTHELSAALRLCVNLLRVERADEKRRRDYSKRRPAPCPLPSREGAIRAL